MEMGKDHQNTETVSNGLSLILFLKVWVLFARMKTEPCLAVVNPHWLECFHAMDSERYWIPPFSPWQPYTSSLHILESLFLPCCLPLKGMLGLRLVWSPQEYPWTCCPFLWAAIGQKLIYKGLHPAWKGISWRKCSLQSAHRKTCLANLRMVRGASSEIRSQTGEGCKSMISMPKGLDYDRKDREEEAGEQAVQIGESCRFIHLR